MADSAHNLPYTLGADEKAAHVMAYTANALYWGEVVVKDVIRVSTWLRTNSAPIRICLYQARALVTSPIHEAKPVHFRELYLPTSEILVFHLVPPVKDPPDFDPSEPNRRVQPVSLLVGSFRVDGSLRVSDRSSLSKYLEVNRESFTSLYDAQITSLSNPAFNVISVPYLIFRQDASIFTLP
jgi:hypothetical protein